ncbi:hypothetical protein CRV24_004149 [Beauveria bassiana]|nr:hypothetical protein CRV24_004149 [Beauveria bassiana]
MDDPWSTPWAVDGPSASPGLPPAREGFERSSPWGEVAPRQHNGGEHGDEDDNDNENDWRGWDDGKQIAWDARIAPLGEPADGLATPWGIREEEDDEKDGNVPDSAAATGLGVRTVERMESKATRLLEDEQDAWTAPQEQDAVIAAAPDEELVRAEESNETEQVKGVARKEEEEEELLGGSTLDWQSQQQQKASKVQELVNMYDGIAKEAARPAAEPVMRESRSAESAEASPEDVFRQHHVGDDVSGVAKDDDCVENQGATAIVADVQPSTTKELGLTEKAPSLNDGIANKQRESAPANTAHDTASSEQLNPQQPHLATTQPNIQHELYPIDLSHLDALFPGSNPPSDTPPASVPDTILRSTPFTTTSERKTWYRVSRLGSVRFHDNGDDEATYRRVAWPSSDIRTKTLDIVRRWMEQDSIAGRVVLGGGRKAGGPLGASMFGWDDGAPQVEIGELLLRRRQQQRSGHADSKGSNMAERGEDGVREKTQMMETAGPSSEAALNGLGFVESSAAKSVRSDPPPPIHTAGITGLGSSVAAPSSSSPMWTPALNSPAPLAPTTTRVSADSGSREKPAVVHGASTPALETPRASTSSNRVSAEHIWTPAASTPTTTTEHRLSTEHAWTATPATNNSAFMETPWTLKVVGAVGATTPSGTSAKPSLDKSVSATDTFAVDEKTVVDEALKSLPDLSYMLH